MSKKIIKVFKSLPALLVQRRIWAFIAGSIVFLISLLKLDLAIDAAQLTDLLLGVGTAIASLISAIFPLWSFLRPKNPNRIQ